MNLEVEEIGSVDPRTRVAAMVDDAAVLSGTRTAPLPVQALGLAVVGTLDLADRWEQWAVGQSAEANSLILRLVDELRSEVEGQLAKG